jgi:hypothetical protein
LDYLIACISLFISWTGVEGEDEEELALHAPKLKNIGKILEQQTVRSQFLVLVLM